MLVSFSVSRTFLPLFLDAAQHAEADFARVAEAE